MNSISPFVIWRFVDGKLGHEKQTQALVEGLQRLLPVELVNIDVSGLQHTLRALLSKRWPELKHLPKPDMALAAGRLTHWPTIAAKRTYGAAAVVIHNPTSVPPWLFDVIITPQHDGFATGGRRLVVPTALSSVVDSHPEPNRGLILIGGESNHFVWQEERLLAQLKTLLNQYPDIQWRISSSRRTPKSTDELLQVFCQQSSNAEFFAVETLSADWLPQQLAAASQIWVTADSASMLGEALNTQAQVGVIALNSRKHNRLNKLEKSITALQQKGEIGWCDESQLLSAPPRAQAANYHFVVSEQLVQLLVKKKFIHNSQLSQ
ncbi:ELM1/GtrOC1 family putative glycosyltransferase [Halioxenophilus sp. WMMB6]|uniref:ELM1/GtrOC1 family putative glycosyltransferase n=1 Tax=Halioxenophilus sp. WMMB6 TaxID=3073815 RepID=UPI00295EE42B|nr:ELM1/GtrOC1 family putative glycosyltransferase [Halioxenophilus sp. WMMB6]